MQRKENGRKIVDFGKVWKCKEWKMQGKTKLHLQEKETARNGIWKEMELARNKICK